MILHFIVPIPYAQTINCNWTSLLNGLGTINVCRVTNFEDVPLQIEDRTLGK